MNNYRGLNFVKRASGGSRGEACRFIQENPGLVVAEPVYAYARTRTKTCNMLPRMRRNKVDWQGNPQAIAGSLIVFGIKHMV
jgi:hypothetical protein